MSAHHRPRKPAARYPVRAETTEPKVKRVPLHLLPTPVGHFHARTGQRRDCQRYEDCLASHVATYPRDDKGASCPRGCRWFVEPARMAEQYTYVADGGSLARCAE